MLTRKKIEVILDQSTRRTDVGNGIARVAIDPLKFTRLVEAATWDAAAKYANTHSDDFLEDNFRNNAEAARRAAKESR